MQIQAFAASDTGRVREHNEDSFCIDDQLKLYVVCDGMGGHAAGEVAAKTAINAIVRVVYEQRQVLATWDGSPTALGAAAGLLRAAVEEASRTIYEVARSDRGKHGMGTTCVALLVLGDKAVMANVGDSRLYLARDGRLHQLSTDHNFLSETIAQGMSLEQAEKMPHANMLTRAVGVQPTVRVDLLTFDLLPGDTLLLCSDGLYDYAREPDVLAGLLGVPDASSIPRTLVLRALSGGGHDNATALVVRAVAVEQREEERKSDVTGQLSALQQIDLFRDFTLAELVKLHAVLTTAYVEAGEQVLREGEPGEHLFIIVEGRFEVAREGVAIATLGRGAHFGEMALLNQRPRSATVTATEPARLLRLDRGSFQALVGREPAIMAKFLWKLAQTLSLRLDDAYLARDFRTGRTTLGLTELPVPPVPPGRGSGRGQ